MGGVPDTTSGQLDVYPPSGRPVRAGKAAGPNKSNIRTEPSLNLVTDTLRTEDQRLSTAQGWRARPQPSRSTKHVVRRSPEVERPDACSAIPCEDRSASPPDLTTILSR